jgi:hypothetical protein
MNTVIYSMVLMLGLVMFFAFYNIFQNNLGGYNSLVLIIPLLMIFGGIIGIMNEAFGNGKRR